MANKRIGLVDYQLDNFHARVYLAAVRGVLAQRGYEIVGATAWDSASSRPWADKNAVTYFDTVKELADVVDNFMVLAPANPELHLEMCEQVLPFGKPSFIDKTFAPNFAVAQQIFDMAAAHNTPIQSTSALRTSNIQEELAKSAESLRSMFITAAGPTFEEYGIHPVELAISCMGPAVESLMCAGSDIHPQFLLLFSDERTAVIDFNTQAELPFTATLLTPSGAEHVAVAGDQLFVKAAASILDFFDAGIAQIDRSETLVIRRILDVVESNPSRHTLISLNSVTTQQTIKGPHWNSATRTSSQRIAPLEKA